MLLQAITIDDRAYEAEKASRSFINTYIFPGGCLPSLEAIARSLARRTDMQAVHLEDITPHYVETLRRWRANFTANAERLAALGYDERFRRLWTLYLCYCEAGFAERRICDVQLLLAKPQHRIAARSGLRAVAWAAATGASAAEHRRRGWRRQRDRLRPRRSGRCYPRGRRLNIRCARPSSSERRTLRGELQRGQPAARAEHAPIAFDRGQHPPPPTPAPGRCPTRRCPCGARTRLRSRPASRSRRPASRGAARAPPCRAARGAAIR